jgi:hypothetical protein
MYKVGRTFVLLLLLLTLGLTYSTQPAIGQSTSIHCSSPIQGATYQTNIIQLNVTLENVPSINEGGGISVNLDGKVGYHGGNLLARWSFRQPPSFYTANIEVPNGNHLLWVQADIFVQRSGVLTDIEVLSQIVNFTVNGPTPTPSSTPMPSPIQTFTPTPSPTVPELSWLTILPILLTIPIALAIVRKRLQRNV